MPTITTVRNQCNNLVNGNVLTRVAAHCDTIRFNRGDYPQLLSTHTWDNIPRHTNLVSGNSIPDNLNNLPPGENVKWNDIITEFLSTALPCAFELNAYGAEGIRGYELGMRFFHAGRMFVRVLNIGPESYREHDWREEPLEP
jgi:hypothetical protein